MGDYFGLDKIVSIILAIIPPTCCICGIITRIQDGQVVAGILRFFFGWNIIWIIDLILMIMKGSILRIINV